MGKLKGVELIEDAPTYYVDSVRRIEKLHDGQGVLLQWQTTPPTVTGAYWVVADGAKIVVNVVYIDVLCVEEAHEYHTPVTSQFYTHWLGPLPIPEAPKG